MRIKNLMRMRTLISMKKTRKTPLMMKTEMKMAMKMMKKTMAWIMEWKRLIRKFSSFKIGSNS
jgi:hypothetical protein